MRKPRPTRTVALLKNQDNSGKHGTKTAIKQFNVVNFVTEVSLVILLNTVGANIRRCTGDVPGSFVRF
jgi:hypothetical protein